MDFKLTRNRVLGAIAAIWLTGLVATFTIPGAAQQEPVVVVHWSNGHLLRDGSGLRLLRQMAAEFSEQVS